MCDVCSIIYINFNIKNQKGYYEWSMKASEWLTGMYQLFQCFREKGPSPKSIHVALLDRETSLLPELLNTKYVVFPHPPKAGVFPIKRMGSSSEVFKRTPKSCTKILCFGCGLKWFSPLMVTNSKTTHQLWTSWDWILYKVSTLAPF